MLRVDTIGAMRSVKLSSWADFRRRHALVVVGSRWEGAEIVVEVRDDIPMQDVPQDDRAQVDTGRGEGPVELLALPVLRGEEL